VLGLRNRKSNILATIERDRNRDISKASSDFDHTHFRCCTISVVRYQAISSVRTVQQSRQSMECADNNGRGGEGASTGQLDYGHGRVISVKEAPSRLTATWSFVGNGKSSLIAARSQLLIDRTNC